MHVLLVARDVDFLAEVAAPVEQAGADERNTEIRSGLGVIAGQHSETARIDRQ